ncbi:Thyrotropin-releasing hormone-degrading ectoenzyme [Armadillidium nasatum]|uniref:Thyrotropin-releasing hormone-degrading ectoenzyme n=1 Tax=Armadillidium nasatum TaxID=96803 RepID=A0A5N5TN68_9CRUS|nr:Thyrotropin-releasing hormone-degrading ectoenzyme [Armadillidium nasatum]
MLIDNDTSVEFPDDISLERGFDDDYKVVSFITNMNITNVSLEGELHPKEINSSDVNLYEYKSKDELFVQRKGKSDTSVKTDGKKSEEKRRKDKKNNDKQKGKTKIKKAKIQKPEAESRDTKTDADSKLRLPSSVVPVHYVLRLHPRFDEDFLVTGSVEIEVEVREATQRLKLHASHIHINKTSVKVTLLKVHKKVPIRNVKLNAHRQFLNIKLSRKLKPGRVYVVSLQFKYHLSEEAKGFYKISYFDSKGRKM